MNPAILDFLKSLQPSHMKGKTVMWWITISAQAMCWYALINSKPLDGSIAVMYGIAVSAFAGGKAIETFTEKREKPRNTKLSYEGE